MDVTVTDNTAAHRFEAEIDGLHAVAEYRITGDTISFTHTEVPEQFRGQGVGEALAEFGLNSARDRNLKVEPLCRFIAAYIERNPNHQDLVRH